MTQIITHPALRPEGFQPLLMGKAAHDRRLVNALLDGWEAQGFAQVAPINVDFSDTLFPDHSQQAHTRTFRFMDSSSESMLALLPDVTLGIARLAKGELAQTPRPLRLAYEGQAIRAKGSATQPARQFGQVGIEIIGVENGKSTSFEMISLAIKSLQDLGLSKLSLTLVDPPLAALLIKDELPMLSQKEQTDLAQALDRKDEGKIKTLAGEQASYLLSLMRGQQKTEPILQTLMQLKNSLFTTFKETEIQISIEPFEQRGFVFQSGPSFAIYSPKIEGELGRGGTYELEGERCFGFTLYRNTLLSALENTRI